MFLLFLLSNFKTFLAASAIWGRNFKRNRGSYLAAGAKWREMNKSRYRGRLTTADLSPRSRLGGEEGPVGDGGVLAGHPAGSVGVPGGRGQLHPDTGQLPQLGRGEIGRIVTTVGSDRSVMCWILRKALLKSASCGYSEESLLTKHPPPNVKRFALNNRMWLLNR